MSNQRRSRTPADTRNPARNEAAMRGLVDEMMQGREMMRPGQIFPVAPGRGGEHADETIEEALWKAAGHLAITAGWLGISIRKLRTHILESERLQEVIEEIEELKLDKNEVQLEALCEMGIDKAVIFRLKTKGKRRGFGENKVVETKHTFTLETARELERKFRPAMEAIRQEAISGLLIEATAEPVAEPPPAVETHKDVARDGSPDADFPDGDALLD